MVRTLKSSKYIDVVVYFILLVISALFIYLFSRGTSPFYCFYGHDSAIFITMGQAFLDCKIPYVDFFDHKGPVLIFINAFGQLLIKGRGGIFLLQILNLSIALFFIYKVSRLMSNSFVKAGVLISIFLLFFRFTITEGNLTEEYSLPYMFLAIYVTFKFYFKQKNISTIEIILLGLCFFIPFWIRANNVGVVCACIVFIAFVLFREKRFKHLIKFIGLFSLTALSLTFLLFGYFLYREALDEMLYSSFVFNFKYADIPDLILPKYARYYTVFIISALLSLGTGLFFYYKKYKDRGIVVFALLIIVFGILPLFLTGVDRLLLHYMTLTIPVLIIGLVLLFNSVREGLFNNIGLFVILLSIVIMGISIQFRYDKIKNADRELVCLADEIFSEIPDDEKNDVFLYYAPPSLYLITEIRPSFKYFVSQDFHGKVDPVIFKDINEMVKSRKPLWIITEIPSLDKFNNVELSNILRDDYYLSEKAIYNKDKLLSVYRLKK